MQKILQFARNKKSIDIVINSVGNYLNVFFVIFFSFLLFRIFSPTEFAVYGVLTTFIYLLANGLDFGTPATIYSYLPPLIEHKTKELYRFLKSVFLFQSISTGIVIIVLILIFPLLDELFFKTHAPYWELVVSSVSVIFFVWQNFFLNIFFAGKKFLEANIILNISNIIKTILIGFLVLLDLVSVGSIMAAIGIIGPSIFYILLFWQKRTYLKHVFSAPFHMSDIRFQYTLVYFGATQFLNLALNFDVLLLSFFRSFIPQADVGFYAAGKKVVLTIITTVVSITQVLSPAFSRIKTRTEALDEFKHAYTYMLLPCILFIGVTITPNFFYVFFFGETFLPAVNVIRMIALPFILFPLSAPPMLFLLYTATKSHLVMIAYLLFLLLMISTLYTLIPIFGIVATVYAISISLLVMTLFLSAFAYVEFKRLYQ